MKRNASTTSPGKGLDVLAELSADFLEKSLRHGAIPAQGQLDSQALGRFSSAVLAMAGPAHWAFSADAAPPSAGRPRRRWWLSVQATVDCRCERCLEPVRWLFESRRGFEFFASAALADRATEQQALHALEATDPTGSGADPMDPPDVDFLSSEDGLCLRDLVEDELLLALPMAPKHADCAAPGSRGAPGLEGQGSAGSVAGQQTERPFAGLKDLLKKP